MIPTDTRAAFLRSNWKRFTCAEDVPPFAVMRVASSTNTDGEIVYTTAKPNTTFRRFYMVNGPFYVAAGKEGLCTTLADAGYVQYNTSSGTPAVGEIWGPKSAQWSLEKGSTGFLIQGGIKSTAGTSVVVAAQYVTDRTTGVYAYDGNGTVSIGSSELQLSFTSARGFVHDLNVSSSRITSLRDNVGVGINYGGALFRSTVPSARVDAQVTFRRFNSSNSELGNTPRSLATWSPSIVGLNGVGGSYYDQLNTGDYIQVYLNSSTSETFAIDHWTWHITGLAYDLTGSA